MNCNTILHLKTIGTILAIILGGYMFLNYGDIILSVGSILCFIGAAYYGYKAIYLSYKRK